MNDSLYTFFGIYFLSLFKFIAGPVLGSAAGYQPWQMMGVTILSMMSSVTIFTFLGDRLKKIYQSKIGSKKKLFTRRNRNIVSVWSKYGELGIAFLTPILLTPIGGTLILVSFGTQKRRIFTYMFLSAVIWAAFFSYSIDWILSIPAIKNLLG
ncbi:hypothetical protein CLV31_108160 [Algoriphagus aquaeductus]|uniref:Small multi-drug export protein n=1 Tax=Algoriphagus aquaeductus TaxID=475299 RepID=A0A326RNJ9_9BACT|nr:hypothetical protein [Algoriphagus aquaeductus]PZV82960.1 hypothetical protein CLV31_108160 [Algoriphagus aquaeductus]